jgi:hypothetical protein
MLCLGSERSNDRAEEALAETVEQQDARELDGYFGDILTFCFVFYPQRFHLCFSPFIHHGPNLEKLSSTGNDSYSC